MNLERLRSLREDKDISQAEMAKLLNVSQRAYSRYENSEREIPLASLCILADFHQTSVDYLLGRTNIKKPYPKNIRK